MEIHIGAHPDLTPFSNAPVMPKPEPRGLPYRPRLVTQQMEQGARHTRAMLAYWIDRCGLTLGQLQAVANWGLGERPTFDPSFVSRAKKGTMGISIPNLLAFDALNRAIWTWQAKGSDEAWAVFGPPGAWKVEDAWLDRAYWLPLPEDAKLPMELPDFLFVLVGRLDLPYISDRHLLPANPRRTSEQLSQLLNRVIQDAGLLPRDGIRQLLAAYPVADETRRDRFRGVILGEELLTAAELESELMAVAEAIRAVRGLEVGSYGPSELAMELDQEAPAQD